MTGVVIPGMKIGIEPRRSPRTIPTNMTARLGSLSFVSVFPTSFSTSAICVSFPTTVSRSPSWRISPGVARSSTPLRNTRVMLIPYVFRSRRFPSFFPLSSGLLMIRCFEVRELSILFQSMFPEFQSWFSCSPKRIVSLFTFSSSEIIISRSSASTVMLEVGILTSPSLQSREITNSKGASFFTC